LSLDTPLDQTATLNSQAATATPNGAAVTATAASELAVSVAVVSGSVTGIYSGNAFTGDSTLNGDAWAHLITSSAGTYSAQWNESPAGTYASSTALFKAAGAISACDLNADGVVNVLDVQLAADMYLGSVVCTAPSGLCNVAFHTAMINAALPGGGCFLPVLGVSPGTLSFGNIIVGNSRSQSVTLSVTGSGSATISDATVTGAGFSLGGPSLPLTVGAGQTANFTVTFTPSATGNVIGAIAFMSSALDSPLNASLSGAGVNSHAVSLSWTASTSQNVAGYNVYRIASPSPTPPNPPYPKLNSALVSGLTYT